MPDNLTPDWSSEFEHYKKLSREVVTNEDIINFFNIKRLQKDFNSYGSRRGNDRVMTRGTFANVRIRNQIAPGTEGGFTKYFPTGEVTTVYGAAMEYKRTPGAQRCAADGLWFACAHPECTVGRECKSNRGLFQCACPTTRDLETSLANSRKLNRSASLARERAAAMHGQLGTHSPGRLCVRLSWRSSCSTRDSSPR